LFCGFTRSAALFLKNGNNAVGAHGRAKSAAYALVGVKTLGDVIPLGVDAVGQPKYLFGAGVDAKRTALAVFRRKFHFSFRHIYVSPPYYFYFAIPF